MGDPDHALANWDDPPNSLDLLKMLGKNKNIFPKW